MKNTTKYKLAVLDLFVRVVLFALYYTALILLGVYLFWRVYQYLFVWVDQNGEHFTFNGVVLGIIAAIYFSFVVLPIFVKGRKADDDQTRVKVTREECPKLFQVIDEVADGVKSSRPKQVYLTYEINAAAFIQPHLWNIILPSNKNLTLGLGLFSGMSIDELKCIIAHEFGHFSQRSMRFGPATSVTVKIIERLVQCPNWINELLEGMFEIPYIRFIGLIVGLLIRLVQFITSKMYRFVLKPYLRLSRFMEYDADRVACSYVGSQVFISSMCKTEYKSQVNEDYHGFLQHILKKGLIVNDYFEAMKFFFCIMPLVKDELFDYQRLQDVPISDSEKYRKLEMTNTWDFHPSMRQRIKQAKELNTKGTVGASIAVPAESLVKKEFFNQVSQLLIDKLKGANNKPLHILPNDLLEKEMMLYYEQFLIASEMKPFFDRYPCDDAILTNNQTDIYEKTPSDKNPFTEEAAEIIADYDGALSDYKTAFKLINKMVEADDVLYDGKVYSPKSLPLSEIKEIMERKRAVVADIDKAIFQYMIQNAANQEEVDDIRFLNSAWHYTSLVLQNPIDEMMYKRQLVLNMYERSELSEKEEAECYNLTCDFEEVQRQVIGFVSNSGIHQLVNIRPEEEAVMSEYSQCVHKPPQERLRVEVPLADYLFDIFHLAYLRASKLLSDIALQQYNQVLDDKHERISLQKYLDNLQERSSKLQASYQELGWNTHDSM